MHPGGFHHSFTSLTQASRVYRQSGRYVFVLSPIEEPLSIAELEVYVVQSYEAKVVNA